MENTMDWALLIFGVIVAAAYGYKTYLEWQDADFDGKLILIEQLVSAAEQMLRKQPGSTRFEWVKEEIKKRFPDADRGESRILIEAAVSRMNQRKPVIIVDENKSQLGDQGGAYWLNTGRHN